MQALLVIDVQNEFSPRGARPVVNHAAALTAIASHVARARAERRPIAWIRHHNRPHESPAFRPGTWGAELSPGCGPEDGHGPEILIEKDVFGAFAGPGLESWLREHGVDAVLIVGFYAHMCVSTTTREALVRDFAVALDPAATGACALEHPVLGKLSAEQTVAAAFLHLAHMGAVIGGEAPAQGATPARQAKAS